MFSLCKHSALSASKIISQNLYIGPDKTDFRLGLQVPLGQMVASTLLQSDISGIVLFGGTYLSQVVYQHEIMASILHGAALLDLLI